MEHRLKRLFLGNWMSFGATVFEMERMKTFLSGHNGSGKTTVMDALSLILYAEKPSYLNFTGDQKRNDHGAIHWNTPNGFLRPGKTTSYIIIEIEDANKKTYHQGIRMVSSGARQTKVTRTFFQGEGTLESIGAAHGAYEAVKNGSLRMDTVYGGDRDTAFKAFFARRGFPVDTFIRARFRNLSCVDHFRLMNQSILSNTGIGGKKLSEYAKENILPSASTTDSIQEMSEAQKKLDQLIQADKALAEKSGFLEKAVDKGQKYLDAKAAYEHFPRAAANINYEYYKEEKAKAQADLEQWEPSEAQKQEDLHEVTMEYGEAMKRLGQLQEEEDPASRYQAEKEKKLPLLKMEEERAKRHETYVNARTAYLRILPPGTEPEDAGQFIESLADKKEKAHEQYLKDREAASGLQGDIDTMRGMLEGNFTKGTGRLSEALRSAILLKAKIARDIPGSDPQLLSDCVEKIADPGWQDAIERLFGRDRMGVIVNPEHYRQACAIQHSIKGNRRSVIVLNTERSPSGVPSNAVPSVVICSDSRAERYIQSAYGKYVLCETDEQYASAVYGLRKNGQTKVPNRSVLHGEKEKVTRMLGAASLKKEIAAAEEQLIVLKEKAGSSWEKYLAHKEKEANAEKVKASYESVKCFRDETAKDRAAAIKKDIEKLEEMISAYRCSNEGKEREAQLIRAKEKADEAERAIERLREEYGAIAHEVKKRRENLKNINAQYDDYEKMAKEEGPLTDEDLYVIQTNEWERRLRGKPQENAVRGEVKKQLDDTKHAMDEFFGENRDIMNAMPGAPLTIERQKDLDWFEDESQKVFDIRMGPEGRRQVEQVRESLKTRFTSMLHGMYLDLERAREVRKKFNSFLPKYKIGLSHYRLGEIQLSGSVEDSYLLELAIRQEENGEQVTQTDVQYMEAVFDRAVKSAGRGLPQNPFDYRLYVTTRMEYRTDDMENEDGGGWKNADRSTKNNSNGQQAILRAVIKIVVLASQAFTENSLRVCITDEVLQGVDDVNSAYFFDALKEMDIQCIFASMDDRFAIYADDSYTFRMEQGKKVRIIKHGIRGENDVEG